MLCFCIPSILSTIDIEMYEFTAALSCNTLYRTFQGRILISKPGRRYKKQVTEALQEQRRAKQYQTITEPCTVDIQLRFKSKRKRDVDNALKPLLDSMQDAEVLENDHLIHKLSISKEHAETDSIRIVIN
uniref:Holliday junction resolvase n=1 Tax=Percolomonas cosmopolitus TaxID=63605 RepID=A0A7S1KRS3_9EUKA|mmetsp:Transcript_6750/g.25238  ORF Transcript_6750/g.25238 Transcript_6750/m.25238 type:complete len:130 (+) Transcript_6750:17-406(+)